MTKAAEFTKRCSKCKETKPVSEFNEHRGYANGKKGPKDGRQNYCRECGAANDARKRADPEWKARYLAQRKEHYQANRERLVAAAKKRAQESPEKVALASRKWGLKSKYGISLEVYDKILEIQGGGCAICRKPAGKGERGWLHVDHDHDTGQVRSLLCTNCNKSLGGFRDDPALLRLAADYVEMWKSMFAPESAELRVE